MLEVIRYLSLNASRAVALTGECPSDDGGEGEEMPEFQIIDTHVHLMDTGRLRYPEIEAAGPKLAGDFLMADFDRLRGGVEVEKLVFLEVAVPDEQQLDEARFVQNLASREPRIGAIVAAARIERGAAVAEDLEPLAEVPLVRGIRRLIQVHPEPDYCSRPEFIEGVRTVGRFGMHFEICIYHPQLRAAIELARACPDIPIILDHIGKPGILHDLIEPWWSQLRTLASLDNVVCKLSGVITEADHERWTEANVRPHIDRVLDVFGPERVIFGSDWPVSELTHSYADWVGIVDRALSGLSDDERRAVFRDNAARFYRLS